MEPSYSEVVRSFPLAESPAPPNRPSADWIAALEGGRCSTTRWGDRRLGKGSPSSYGNGRVDGRPDAGGKGCWGRNRAWAPRGGRVEGGKKEGLGMGRARKRVFGRTEDTRGPPVGPARDEILPAENRPEGSTFLNPWGRNRDPKTCQEATARAQQVGKTRGGETRRPREGTRKICAILAKEKRGNGVPKNGGKMSGARGFPPVPLRRPKGAPDGSGTSQAWDFVRATGIPGGPKREI